MTSRHSAELVDMVALAGLLRSVSEVAERTVFTCGSICIILCQRDKKVAPEERNVAAVAASLKLQRIAFTSA